MSTIAYKTVFQNNDCDWDSPLIPFQRKSTHTITSTPPAGKLLKYQYLTRTGRLRTYTKGQGITDDIVCDHCNQNRIQNEEHIFRTCPAYEKYRQEAYEAGKKKHRSSSLENSNVPESWRSYLKSLIWGQDANTCAYWLGNVPSLPPELSPKQAEVAHDIAIRLTARISGQYLWRTTRNKYGDLEDDRIIEENEEGNEG